MNEDSASKADLAHKASPLADVVIPPSVDGTGEQASAHDAITRRIRNPFSETGALESQPEAEEKTATPSLPTSSPPADPDATPLPPNHDDHSLATAHAGLLDENTPFSEVSKNIHNLPTPLPGLSDEAAGSPSKPKKHGLIVVAIVIVAGVAVDVFLWKMTGESSVQSTPQAVAAPDVSANVEEQIVSTIAKPPAPIIAPLPALSHIEISVQAENAKLTLDGKVVQDHQLKLDVPSDQDPHRLEVSAPGFAPLKRTVSFAKDLYLAIELLRAPPLPRVSAGAGPARTPTAATKPKKNGRARAAAEPTDEFDSPFVPTKRPPATIDETDPYAP
jgi:hypothetical protein